MSPAILACPRPHFPSSLWGRVLFTSISLGMQPQGRSALHTMPVLLEAGEGQCSGSWCCLPSSIPGRGRWRNTSLPHLRASSSSRGGSAGGSSDLCRSCWAPHWHSLGVHGGGRLIPMEPPAWRAGGCCTILHSRPGAGAVPLPRAQGAPGFPCALQRACRYGGEGI